MFVRTIAIVALSATALLGCGSEPPVEDRAGERWEQISQNDKDALCEGYLVFGENWLRNTFEVLATEESSDFTVEEARVLVDIVIDRCIKEEFSDS